MKLATEWVADGYGKNKKIEINLSGLTVIHGTHESTVWLENSSSFDFLTSPVDLSMLLRISDEWSSVENYNLRLVQSKPEKFIAELKFALDIPRCVYCLHKMSDNDKCNNCEWGNQRFVDPCSVCLNPMSFVNSKRLFTCGHRLDNICIRKIVKRHGEHFKVKCPVCREISFYESPQCKDIYVGYDGDD
jgi:hypothetical protein